MIKVFFTSDLHLGLRTEGINRDDEIYSIVGDIVDKANAHARDTKSEKTILVIGGDIFNTNNPSEKEIARFIDFMNLIDTSIDTYIVVGNHDSISDIHNTSCLSFIESLREKYPNINLIDDIKCIGINKGNSDIGPIYFTFLPHVTKALLTKIGKEDLTPQQYIDKKCEFFKKKIGLGCQHYVFSHLNVIGVKGGSEETLLKKSLVHLPKCFLETHDPRETLPTIIQAHIHSFLIERNVHIVGSPIYCGFGESDAEKYYAVIDIPTMIGEKDKIEFVNTNCVKFHQLELFLDQHSNVDFFSIPEVVAFIEENKDHLKGSIVKLDLKLLQGQYNIDFDNVKKTFESKYKCTVKEIVPKIVAIKVKRNVEQKITLQPSDAVKVFIRSNIKEKEKAREVWKATQKYIS